MYYLMFPWSLWQRLEGEDEANLAMIHLFTGQGMQRLVVVVLTTFQFSHYYFCFVFCGFLLFCSLNLRVENKGAIVTVTLLHGNVDSHVH